MLCWRITLHKYSWLCSDTALFCSAAMWLNTKSWLQIKFYLLPCEAIHQLVLSSKNQLQTVFSARCNIYISRLCYDVSVRLSVTEVHWRIIANLGFKFRSQFTAHCGRSACGREGTDHHREEWRDHLALCLPLLGARYRKQQYLNTDCSTVLPVSNCWVVFADAVYYWV